MALRKLSERGLYACIVGEERRRYVRVARDVGSGNNIS